LTFWRYLPDRGTQEKFCFSKQYAAGTNVVVIEPDIAAEFPTAKEVNETLRAVAQLLQRRRKTAKRKTA
jgi:hypothetical protein